MVAHGSQGQGHGNSDGQQGQQPTAEEFDTGDGVQAEEDGQVPQEDAVADHTEPAGERVGEGGAVDAFSTLGEWEQQGEGDHGAQRGANDEVAPCRGLDGESTGKGSGSEQVRPSGHREAHGRVGSPG